MRAQKKLRETLRQGGPREIAAAPTEALQCLRRVGAISGPKIESAV